MVDPLLTWVLLLVRLVGQRPHANNTERIDTLSHVGDAHCLNELGQTLLHDVFDAISNWDKDIRGDEAPDDLGERVEPLDGLGDRRGKLLSSLLVHVMANSIDLALQLALGEVGSGHSGEAKDANQGGAPEEGPGATLKGEEEPEDYTSTSNDELKIRQVFHNRVVRRR